MVKLSIGLPVYNGEQFLREAIDSILGQTYKDFELIISDNCSTDSTREICEDYAARDSRVRYILQENNLGAAPNFNFVVHEATGEYFKWAAHDDLMDPTCVEKCVRVLDENPDVVVCYTKVQLIDAEGKISDSYDSGLFFDQDTPHERFSEQIKPHRCQEIFGVIRTEQLRKTALIGGYSHGDGVLLGHLGILGKIVRVQEFLFFNREHANQSRNMLEDRATYSEWFDISNKGKLLLPYWRIYYEYFKLVAFQPMSLKSRYWCFRAFTREVWKFKWPLLNDLKAAGRRIFGLRSPARPEKI
ncbi:MAG: glycosyltransferase family 2 protein [Methyloligellaceae bacterium]